MKHFQDIFSTKVCFIVVGFCSRVYWVCIRNDSAFMYEWGMYKQYLRFTAEVESKGKTIAMLTGYWTLRNNYTDFLWLIDVQLMNFNDITVLGNESPSSCVLHLQHSDKAINHYSCSFNYMPLVSGASLLLCKKKFSDYLLI